jgi:hypothetical protein
LRASVIKGYYGTNGAKLEQDAVFLLKKALFCQQNKAFKVQG